MTPSALPATNGAETRQSRDVRKRPHAVAGGEPALAPVHRTTMRSARVRAVEAAAEAWRNELVALGGQSPLSDVGLLGEAVIDLTAAHPSGIAQLYSGRTTRLSRSEERRVGQGR